MKRVTVISSECNYYYFEDAKFKIDEDGNVFIKNTEDTTIGYFNKPIGVLEESVTE